MISGRIDNDYGDGDEPQDQASTVPTLRTRLTFEECIIRIRNQLR